MACRQSCVCCTPIPKNVFQRDGVFLSVISIGVVAADCILHLFHCNGVLVACIQEAPAELLGFGHARMNSEQLDEWAQTDLLQVPCMSNYPHLIECSLITLTNLGWCY